MKFQFAPVYRVFLGGFTLVTLSWAIPEAPPQNNSTRIGARLTVKRSSRWQRSPFPSSAEFNELRESVLTQKRQRLVSQIEALLKRKLTPVYRSELLSRLGRLSIQDYYYQTEISFREFEKKNATSVKEVNQNMPRLDNRKAINSLDKARSIYKTLLTDYPKHTRRDEMLYFYAVAALDRGLITEAMHTFTLLSKQFPKSIFMDEALAQLGDYHFEKGDYAVAESHFKQLVDRDYKPLLSYAVYKRAWCAYNTGRKQYALDNFSWVIRHETEMGTTSQMKIKNEALKDVIYPLADLQNLDGCMEFFSAFDNNARHQGLEAIALLWFDRGNYNDAIAVWDYLVKKEPLHRQNAQYDMYSIEALKLRNDNIASVQRLLNLTPLYLPGSQWYSANKEEKTPVLEAEQKFDELLKRYAVLYHSTGEQTNNSVLLSFAEKIYAKHLEFFPKSPEHGKIRNELANIYFRQGKFSLAAEQYYLAYKGTEDPGLKVVTLANTVSALDRQVNVERKKQGLASLNNMPSSKVATSERVRIGKTAYSDAESLLMTRVDEYLHQYPNAKNSAEVLHEKAYLQYLHHDYDDALKTFNSVLTQFPKNKKMKQSATYLVLDIMALKNDYPALIATSRGFLQEPISSTTLRKDIESLLRHAELQLPIALENKGQFAEAADSYLKYIATYGNQDRRLHEKALYNAGVNYAKAGDMVKSIETREAFLGSFPSSTMGVELMLPLARDYESLGEMKKAATLLESFALSYPQHKEAKSALRLAGLYYWGAGESERGEKTLFTLLQKYPSEESLAREDLLSIYEYRGAFSKAIALLNKKLDSDTLAPGDYLVTSMRIAELKTKKDKALPVGFMKKLEGYVKSHLTKIKKDPKAAEALANLTFWSLQKDESKFHSIKITLPEQRLARSLKRKLELLHHLEASYQQLSRLGSAHWGLGAIYRTAALYHELAENVRAAPTPSAFNAKETDAYRTDIDSKMIKPFETKAFALAKECLKQTESLRILSHWTEQCYTLAANLKPDEFPRLRTFYLPSVQASLIFPISKESKIESGQLESYPESYSVSAYFEGGTGTRELSSIPAMGLNYLRKLAPDLDNIKPISPYRTDYRKLALERRVLMNTQLQKQSPTENTSPSFAYLNLMRLTYPKKAVGEILSALKLNSHNFALHNLLGLAYLESGNLPAAKVTWNSMLANSKQKSPEVLNNLGVLALLQGKENQAVALFMEASASSTVTQAPINLGFLALKYRNGALALSHFDKALGVNSDTASLRVAREVAMIQNREWDNSKEALVELAQKFDKDPYARISAVYFLLDGAKDYTLAKQLISDYLNSLAPNEDADAPFQRALLELNRLTVDQASLFPPP